VEPVDDAVPDRYEWGCVMSLQQLSPELQKLLDELTAREAANNPGLGGVPESAPTPESAPGIGGKFGKLLSIIQGLKTGEGLPKPLQRGIGMASSMMYGEPGQDVSPRDIVNLQEGDQPNRGVGNIMGNIARIGARQRMAGRQLRQGDEDRSVGLDLKRAQAENLRSLGPYRSRMLDIRSDLNEIRRLHEAVYKSKTESDAKNAIAQLEISRQNSEAAMLSAEARMKSAVNEEEKTAARLEFDREKFKYDQAQDAIKNAQSWVSIKTQQGWLEIGQEKAPGQIAGTAADTDLAGARAEEQRRATGQAATEAPIETAGKEMDVLKKGQDTGVITPGGTEAATTSTPGLFQVTPPQPGWATELMRGINPWAPKQRAAPARRPSPPTRPKATGTVTVVGPGGEVREGPAANIAAFLAANPTWRRQ